MKDAELLTVCEHIQLPGAEGRPEAAGDAQRLFHGRGHAYPGLKHVTIDWLPPVALITLFAREDAGTISQLASWLAEHIPECRSVQVQSRFELMGPVELVLGEPCERTTVVENGLKFNIQLGKSRNTGLFLDMRNGRDWVRNFCSDPCSDLRSDYQGQGKKVLNLFSYTCGFSVAALAGGAQSVVNIDMSGGALSQGRENHKLNNLDPRSVRYEKLDIFKSFGRIKRYGPFDLLVCDPPTLQKGSVNIERDYPKIIRRLTDFMAPQSDLLLCLNAPDLGPEFVADAVMRQAPHYDFVSAISPPDVFMEAQGKGLKILHFSSESSG